MKSLFYATTGKSFSFFERLYIRAFCQILIAVLRIIATISVTLKNSKWIIYPMRKGAANSKRMCIICHYLIAQNGDACASFFDTLVGSVNNNACDQVRSVCPIHFSLDHSSDRLISFSTQNSILLLVYLRNYFSPKIRSQVWGAAYTRVNTVHTFNCLS